VLDEPTFDNSVNVHHAPLSVKSPIANNKYVSVSNFLEILICALIPDETASRAVKNDSTLPPASSV